MADKVNSSAVRKLGQIWCGIFRGHHMLGVLEANKWSQRCMHCGHSTPGFHLDSKPPLALSNSEMADIQQEMELIELNLHGGG
jgi:hypothetical protein